MATAGLIVKATRLCNLRCKYCFDWRTGPDQIMPFDVLVRTIAAATSDPRHDTVVFNWHGGEPTVLPISFYERALHLQGRFRLPGQRILNTVQTNATLLDATWVEFFVTNGFAIGVSVDGPRDVHDSARVDRSGRGTFDRVCQGIALLRDHGASFAVILVIDQPTLARGPDALLDFLVEQGIADVALNFVMPAPNAAPEAGLHYVDPAQMSQFLIGLWDARAARALTRISIRELEAIDTSLGGNRPNPCTFAGACLGIVFRVEPNGDVYHCDYFGLDPEYRWGNIIQSDFGELRKSPPLVLARQRERADRAQLESCPHCQVCRGWCPHSRKTAHRHFPAYSSTCCGLAELISHVARNRASAPVGRQQRDQALSGLMELA
ncbi:radical SAM/SPASM domain-containing protein [Nocardia suismassiliense]|uniref:radical SAM/SPASM domain-containing protein n=1 Tax=Nocardia suismassiliense TaxID=2077092 RepID=UPI000D1E64A1|nr:radical SAM protein [Nocardia suismassiliense]